MPGPVLFISAASSANVPPGVPFPWTDSVPDLEMMLSVSLMSSLLSKLSLSSISRLASSVVARLSDVVLSAALAAPIVKNNQ